MTSQQQSVCSGEGTSDVRGSHAYEGGVCPISTSGTRNMTLRGPGELGNRRYLNPTRHDPSQSARHIVTCNTKSAFCSGRKHPSNETS